MTTKGFLPQPCGERAMAELIGRIASAYGAPGYGYLQSPLDRGVTRRIDAVVSPMADPWAFTPRWPYTA